MFYFSLNTSNEMRDEFEQELNILRTKDLRIFLGFPLSHRKPSKNNLTFLIEKMSSMLEFIINACKGNSRVASKENVKNPTLIE